MSDVLLGRRVDVGMAPTVCYDVVGTMPALGTDSAPKKQHTVLASCS